MNRGDRREPSFRDELDHKRMLATLERAQARASGSHPAATRRETTEAKGQRILREELDTLACPGAELAGRARGDARKIRIAQRLRAGTTVTMKWIAAELHLGTWAHVANLLRQSQRHTESERLHEFNLV
jgi:hypothetical protein